VDAETQGSNDNLVALGPALDHRVVLVDGDPRGLTEVGDLYLSQLEAEAFGDRLPAGQDGDALSLISEAGRPDGSNLQRASYLVHDKRRQRLATNVLRDNEKRLATLCDLLKKRQQVLFGTDFLFVLELIFFS
jgi:hypothetical protein